VSADPQERQAAPSSGVPQVEQKRPSAAEPQAGQVVKGI
jgi:hypothetical protein